MRPFGLGPGKCGGGGDDNELAWATKITRRRSELERPSSNERLASGRQAAWAWPSVGGRGLETLARPSGEEAAAAPMLLLPLAPLPPPPPLPAADRSHTGARSPRLATGKEEEKGARQTADGGRRTATGQKWRRADSWRPMEMSADERTQLGGGGGGHRRASQLGARHAPNCRSPARTN